MELYVKIVMNNKYMRIWNEGIIEYFKLYTVQSLLSSRLLSRNVKVKIYKTIIYQLFCMGVKLGLSS
jgi:hypothetical protein